MKQKEEWRPVSGYEGDYEVSSNGRIRSLDRMGEGTRPRRQKGRIIKPNPKQGYMTVMLYHANKVGYYQIHRLVAEAFIPNPENLPFVNHKNEKRDDNRVENLEWCDAAYNSKYGTAITRANEARALHGFKVPVLAYNTVKGFASYYESMADAARALGVCPNTVRNTIVGNTKATADGLIFLPAAPLRECERKLFVYTGKNVPSMKNAFHFSLKTGRKYPDKKTVEFFDWITPKMKADAEEFRRHLPEVGPARVHLFFLRDSNRRWDYINITQIIADAMTRTGMLVDDDVDHFMPVFDGYVHDTLEPGFAMWVE